jgi:3-mercaptopyruvate sulfurtransferase SseA
MRPCGPYRHVAGSVNIPLAGLTAPVATTLISQGEAASSSSNTEAAASARAVVVVVGSGDHRGKQAYVRLTRVFGMQDVLLYAGGLQDWVAHGGELQAAGS